MSFDAAIAMLREHRDASDRLNVEAAGRANGFQHLAGFADGAVRVWYHWGSRSFSSWAELEGWLLACRIPENWQE